MFEKTKFLNTISQKWFQENMRPKVSSLNILYTVQHALYDVSQILFCRGKEAGVATFVVRL